MGKRDLKRCFTPHKFKPNPQKSVTVEVLEEHNLQVGEAGLGIQDFFDQDLSSCMMIDAAIEPGSYPIQISFMRSIETSQLPDGTLHSSTDERITAIQLCISKQPVKTWKQAKLIAMDTKKTWKYIGIDSGWAGIFDIATMKKSKNWLKCLQELSTDQSMRSYYPPASPQAVGVSSGYGDGQYICYLGYDKQKEICAIALDFECIPDEKSEYFDYTSLEGGNEYEHLGLWVTRQDRWRSVPLDPGAYVLKIVCDGTQLVGKAHPILLDDQGSELELSTERIETTDSGKKLTLVKFPTVGEAKKIRMYFYR